MDILDQAIEFEFNGHKFYSEKAALTTHPAVKMILESLAKDEINHAEFLKKLKAGAGRDYAPSRSMHEIQNVLADAVRQSPSFLSDEGGLADLLTVAMGMEEKSRDHYRKEAAGSSDPEVARLLDLLAREEQAHYNLLHNMEKFLNSPAMVLESPEFHWYE